MAPSIIKQKGFSLVEILIAITIFAIFSVAIFYLSIDTLQRDSKIELDNVALHYAQEGLEAVRNMRDRNFLLLSNGDHGLIFDAIENLWSFGPAPESIDGFYERTVTIEDVYRDSNGNIVEDGEIFDPDTKLIISEVGWRLRGVFPRNVTLTTYLSNWTGNDWMQTTCAEFNGGTFENINLSTTPPPPSENCALQLIPEELPSEFFSSVNIGDHANDVEVDGNYAYISNDKRSHGLTIVDISNTSSPLITQQLNIGSKSKFLHKNGPYVYMGVDGSQGLAIVDVSAPDTGTVVSMLAVEDYGNNLAVFGDNLYMGVEQTNEGFFVVDVLDKANPGIITSMDLDDKVHAVELSPDGQYAYLGVEEDDAGFVVLDVSDPSAPVQISYLDLGEEVNAIFLDGIFAFVGTEESDNSLYVINISDPANPTVITSLDVGGEIQDLVIEGDYLYAAVDEQNAGMAAINISNPTNPTPAYALDITGKGKGIDADANYVYVAITTNNRGLVIVGHATFSFSEFGTYTSAPFDTGSGDTRYNFIEWDHIEVPGGDVNFRIRTAATESGLASANWVGPDGTPASYYSSARTPIVLDPAASGPRFIQYQVYFASDGMNSPLLESIRINYNP